MSNARFVPFGSFVDAGFWSALNKLKLDHWKLDESAKAVKSSVELSDTVGSECRLTLSHESFGGFGAAPELLGEIFVYNTIEAFKSVNRKEFLVEKGEVIFRKIRDHSFIEDPSVFYYFAFTVFADLKKFHYYYWTCSPAVINLPDQISMSARESRIDAAIFLDYFVKNRELVFLLRGSKCCPLSQLRDCNQPDEIQVVFADPSPVTNVPGWPARNLLAAIALYKPSWDRVSFISLREQDDVTIFDFSWNNSNIKIDPAFTGWEPHPDGQLKPRFVNMRNQFDPVKLMDQSVRLNLSLIKWRLVPELQLERFEKLRVLIFGAGTLGCNIARNLMAYNVKTISFVDNSNVSYSNPVRQSLSKFEDARNGRGKAETAAEGLREIYPSMDARAFNLTVPMPGHCVSEQEEEKLQQTVQTLEDLVESHDVLFLALDSREARWFPTVLANKFGKIVFSVALGFDTYVIIRHGVSDPKTNDNSPQAESARIAIDERYSELSYQDLACYFCSDVTAPGNSTSDRTLDQQCTVSRPGISPVAAGIAVELLASVLQYENPRQTPARIDELDENSSVLGATPHQVRGFIYKFQHITPCIRRFEKCVACGSAVSEIYLQKGWEFLRDVMNSPSLLESVTGLDQLQTTATDVQIDFSDSESVLSLASL